MTTTAALRALLLDQTTHDTVVETPQGAQVTASTRTAYTSLGEATRGAQFLLEQLLDLGFCIEAGMVGAERTDAGHWRGQLVGVLVAPVGEQPPAYHPAA
jgi:hypothetical protein